MRGRGGGKQEVSLTSDCLGMGLWKSNPGWGQWAETEFKELFWLELFA